MIETELLRDIPLVNNFIMRNLFRPVTWMLFKNLKDGAQTTIYCAVDERLDNESGKYYRYAKSLLDGFAICVDVVLVVKVR